MIQHGSIQHQVLQALVNLDGEATVRGLSEHVGLTPQQVRLTLTGLYDRQPMLVFPNDRGWSDHRDWEITMAGREELKTVADATERE